MNQCNDRIVWDLEICKDISLLKKADGIIIYGAGVKGREALRWLDDANIKIDCFCDMDIQKWGDCFEGKQIISPFQLAYTEKFCEHITYLIACIQYPKEVLAILNHMRNCNIRVITYWGIKMALWVNARYIYDSSSKRIALLEIEKRLMEMELVEIGLSHVQNIMNVPDHAVWIILPGKTASTSLETRFRTTGIDSIKEHQLEYPAHIIGEEYREIWEGRIEEKRKSLKLITAVREPLSRDYSAFWQAFPERGERGTLMPIFNKDFQRIYDCYVKLILKGNAEIKKQLGVFTPYTWNDEFEWFDEQIKKYLDIDVFQYSFDREKGYTIINKEGIELFLFKVEKFEDILEEIGAFVGATEFPSINGNVSEQKWYGLAYAQFRKDVKLPEEYVKHYYDGNDKMDFFYTPEEKKAFLENWKRNIIGHVE